MSPVAGRDNGLSAATYAALADVEPRLADVLLEVFRDEGIAAYAEPAGTRSASDLSMPRVAGAMDRLFVDSGERLRARDVFDARLPGLQRAFEGGAERVETGHGDSGAGGSAPSGSTPPGSTPAATPSAPAGSKPSGTSERGPVEQGPVGPQGPPQEPADPVRGGPVATPTPQEQEDAAWRAIVAGWDDTAADPIPRWPAADGTAGTAGPGGRDGRDYRDGPDGSPGTLAGDGPDVEPGGRTRRTGRHRDERPDGHRAGPGDPRPGAAGDASRRHPRGTWGRAAPGGPRGRRRGDPPASGGAEEERYVPPPPPPLPRADAVTVAAWAALLGGPALVIVMTLAGLSVARSVAVLALVAFVGGFVTLVARMQDRPPTDSGPDDGAVV